jgi:hypothetical protein
MNTDALAAVFAEILEMTSALVRSHGLDSVRNERYFHHMFSYLAACRLWPDNQQVWRTIVICPEAPTALPFRFKEGRRRNAYFNVELAQTLVVNGGKRGNIDFALMAQAGQPRALVEWKGPKTYCYLELVEVFLKLLHEPLADVKVLAAVIVTPPTHLADWKDRFVVSPLRRALDFAVQVARCPDIHVANLHSFVGAVMANGENHPLLWGSLPGVLNPGQGLP